ncbi:MAG: ribbon-helix-helix domain-containing protein [Thermodesulfobacteriota bacterium]
MSSIRLPAEMEQKLQGIAETEKTTKSEIIKQALQQFFDAYEETALPFELGKDLFGRHGSSQGNLSKDYKKIIKEKVHAKHPH